MAGKRKPHITIQQRKLLKALISGKSITDAAKEAGYSFRESASRVLRNVTLRDVMLAEMEAGGIGPKVLVEKIDEHLQAKRKDGHPDYIVQHMTLDTSLKILGLYAPVRNELTGKDGGPVETREEPPLTAKELAAALHDKD